MADENKQFEASEQKLRKAREQGQVAKSKDVSVAISLIIMFSVLYAYSPVVFEQLTALFTFLYEQIPNERLDEMGRMYIVTRSVLPPIIILGPLLAVSIFVGILGDMIQVGPLFTLKTLEPNFNKFNPTKFFKNLANPKTLFDLLKNVVKVSILGPIAYVVYKSHLEAVLILAALDNPMAILAELGSLILDFVIKAGIAFLIIAVADYGVAKWKFLQDQKMSFKEVKDEYKNSEGDPNVKAALRQRRQQLLQKKMMDEVATCDFVVTNPTHVAVAIKYDPKTMESPKLVAKGSELFAQKIKEIAYANNVPVIENPPVARALFRMVEIGRQIPPDLYKAVAEILIFVYKLKKTTAQQKERVEQTAIEKGDVQTQAEIQKKKDESLKKFKDMEDNS